MICRFAQGAKILSYEPTVSPAYKNDPHLSFGPFENVNALDTSKIKVHVQQNLPLMVAKTRTVTYQISHLGNKIDVNEQYDLYHRGAL